MAKGPDGRYTATIPPTHSSPRVRYYAEARSAEHGTVSYLPPQAEFGALSFKVWSDD